MAHADGADGIAVVRAVHGEKARRFGETGAPRVFVGLF